MIKMAGLFLIALLSAQVMAIPNYLNGNLTFKGGAQFNAPIGSATAVTNFNSPTVESADGDFSSYMSLGDPVTITQPWVFNPSTAYPVFYQVGGFTVELFGSSIEFQNANFLAVTGSILVTGNGFDPTPGIFNFTSQGPEAQGWYSFSAANGVAGFAVPDGGSTLMLMGAGLTAVAFMQKGRRRSK